MKPIQKFRAGGVQVAIWSSEAEVNGGTVDVKSVTLQKTYKDRNGDWKCTTSLKSADLPKAVVLLGKACEFLAKVECYNEITNAIMKVRGERNGEANG